MIILPRDAVSRVTLRVWYGLMKVTVGDDGFTIYPPTFSRRRTIKFLAENGWVLNQDLNPIAPPIHAAGYRRQPGTTGGRSMWLRVLYGIIAAAILAAIVLSHLLR